MGGSMAALVVLVFGLVASSSAAPAIAHAFGDPPRAWLGSQGREVTLDWVAEADDAAAVGHAIGLLPIEAVWAFIEEVPEEEPTPAQTRALSASPDLRDYLLEHVSIRQGGRRCDGVAEPAVDFIADGARLRFTCPDPVTVADVRITLLHDQDPAYRTFGVDGTDQLTIHTVAQPEHRWDFARVPADGRGPAAVLIVGLVLAVIAAVASLRLLRPRTETTAEPTTS
jgi:hypothetical protein